VGVFCGRRPKKGDTSRPDHCLAGEVRHCSSPGSCLLSCVSATFVCFLLLGHFLGHTGCTDAACCCYRCSVISLSVCLSVSLLDTTVSRTKMAEPVEMPFRLWTRVELRNHVGGSDPPRRRGRFRGCPPP